MAKLPLKILFLMLMFITSPLHAEDDLEDIFSYSLEQLLQIDITGSTLTPTTSRKVPSAVTTFTHAEIKRMGLDTLSELMNLVPGFQSYRSSASSSQNYFSSRGRRIAGTGSDILILVDGQRFDEPRTSGSTTTTPQIPLMNIERVEFIRGPGGAVYGSNAMLGVINILTRSDTDELSVGYGSFNRQQAYLLTSQKIGEVSIDLFGHINSDNGDKFHVQDTFSPDRIKTDDPQEQADVNIKMRWKNTQITYQHSEYNTDNFYELGNLANGFNEQKAQFDAISIRQDFSWNQIDSWLRLDYHTTDVTMAAQLTAPGDLLGASGGASNDPLLFIADFDDSHEYRMQLHNDWYLNAQSSLQFGLEFRYIDIANGIGKNNFDLTDLANSDFPIRYYGNLAATTVVQNESTRNIVGVYGQYQYQLFEATHLTAGMRYDDFSNVGNQLSPRLGLVQELNPHHSIKMLYGESFRAPAENEMYLANNPVSQGNPDLKAETVQTWDLIWIGQWPTTRFSLGYFENHFKNSIAQSIAVDGTLRMDNVSQSPTKGVEFEISQELNEHWRLSGSTTYFHEQPNSSFREADTLISLRINYQYGHWNANIIGNYRGKSEMSTAGDDTNRIKLDDYWQFFGKVLYNFNADWQGFIQAKNMLDENYETPTANATMTEGVPNRGVELLTGLVWQF